MDAIQFGRWLSERRRQHGWNSQRAFVEAARQHPLLSEQHISADFLARLEAGLFVHPFRGSVRQRVLVMAALLCKTSREVRTYLRAAEFTKLNDDEAALLSHLNGYLATWRNSTTLLPLPPRPTRLFGRASLLEELINTLSTLETGLCALTGMPGIGKSALAYEVVHRLASNEGVQLHVFPDGIATFTCTGRRGLSGLVALLNEIADVFSPSASSAAVPKQAQITPSSSEFTTALPGSRHGELAEAIDRVRLTIASKRLLLLLDDMDAGFPLRQLLESLFALNQNGARGQRRSDMGQAQRIVLTTSRYIPAPTLLAAHFHLGPLEPEAALDLLTTLIGRTLDSEERADAQQLCAAVGYLPLALEVAATSVKTRGIPLALLAACAVQRPLDRLLDGEQELSSTLMQALEPLDPEMRQRFALLPTLGAQSFGLESATAISLPALDTLWLPRHNRTPGNRVSTDAAENAAGRSLAQLANTAADLGQFVRHSLVELVVAQERSPLFTPGRDTQKNEIRYRLHPLLYALALDCLSQLEPKVVNAAELNVQSYAQSYIERYQENVPHLVREREFLLASLAQAWQQDRYPLVVHFVSRLLPVIGSYGDYKEGESVLHWGIHASQHLQDRYHAACFMNRLAVLYFYRGEFNQARQIWEECLEIAEALGYPVRLWVPLANLALVAEMHGEYETAQRLAETYLQRAADAANPFIVAHALLTRGTFARRQGERDRAYDDLSSSVHLLSLHSSTDLCIEARTLLAKAQVELARTQKDYARSQEYTDATIPLFQETADLYGIPEMLFEQARFARQEGMFDDARTLARRAVYLAKQIGASHLRMQGMNLLRQLLDASLA